MSKNQDPLNIGKAEGNIDKKSKWTNVKTSQTKNQKSKLYIIQYNGEHY